MGFGPGHCGGGLGCRCSSAGLIPDLPLKASASWGYSRRFNSLLLSSPGALSCLLAAVCLAFCSDCKAFLRACSLFLLDLFLLIAACSKEYRFWLLPEGQAGGWDWLAAWASPGPGPGSSQLVGILLANTWL